MLAAWHQQGMKPSLCGRAGLLLVGTGRGRQARCVTRNRRFSWAAAGGEEKLGMYLEGESSVAMQVRHLFRGPTSNTTSS